MLNKIINLKFWNFTSYSWRKSFSIASYIIALLSSVLSIIGVSFQDIRGLDFWIWIIILIFVYMIIALIMRIILSMKKEYIIKVRKNKIEIKVGDIFKEKGLILIPFNEYFDTEVDDNIISKNSLHGKFLTNCKIDTAKFKKDILESNDPKMLQRKETSRGVKFPLGRIIKYKNKYLLLAFSHFDQDNKAYITRIEYEKCLATMWKELRRTYSGEPIILPLIGSGITSFVGLPEKSNWDLLKCMICTLKFSNEQFQNDIKIIVTEDVWNDLDLVNNILEL
jgi:hypothetical protein